MNPDEIRRRLCGDPVGDVRRRVYDDMVDAYHKYCVKKALGFYDQKEPGPVKPVKVIFNYPATIVFWSDDTKTVVKCQGDDVFDPEKGLAMAYCKKMLGNKGNYYKQFKKWLPEE